MSAAADYREYVDIVRPANAPRAELNDFQLVSSSVRLWWLRTRHPLGVVLQNDFFQNVADLRLKAEDRVKLSHPTAATVRQNMQPWSLIPSTNQAAILRCRCLLDMKGSNDGRRDRHDSWNCRHR